MKLSEKTPDLQDLLSLYAAVGWTNYTSQPQMLASAFEQSLYTLYAYEADDLLGLVRVVGDGHSLILIQDLLVQPAYQRQGIGKQLMQAVLEKYAHVYQIQLTTDKSEKNQAFYTSLGFVDLGQEQCRGMIFKA